MLKHGLLLLLLAFTNFARGECVNNNCIFSDSWQIGLAGGLGERSNPLRGGDDQPLVVVADVAWYGDVFYFDNLEAGYQWQSDENFAFDTYFVLNREARAFKDWHSFDVLSTEAFLSSDNDTQQSPSFGQPVSRISLRQIQSRDWAVHAGIRAHWRNPASEWQLAIQTDASGVHQGQLVNLQYQQNIQMGQWQIGITPNLAWNSAAFNDYYYGVGAEDTLDERLHYHAGSGFRPGVNLSAARPINENWGVLLFFRYQHLPSSLTHSPLVKSNHISSIFAGVTYHF